MIKTHNFFLSKPLYLINPLYNFMKVTLHIGCKSPGKPFQRPRKYKGLDSILKSELIECLK